MAKQVLVEGGQRCDAWGMAVLFLECFPESVRDMFGGRRPRPEAMSDFFTFVLHHEPEAVHTAKVVGGDNAPAELVGYVITPRHMPRLWLLAAASGAWAHWVARFLTGRYGVGLDVIPRLLRQKLAFASTFRPAHRCRAQVLSLAVASAWQGQGIGRALLERGLEYLRRRNVARVKLEVLRANTPALNLYLKEGFRPVAKMPDGNRLWIVMTKDLLNGPT